ncbi:histidine kinase N-terminal 7TM domain-containing protein [Desulfotomaculum copahuensis]|uniref:histidine kinase N-terminal 7TM domain-containing protein n=1 Tax=Desulfotomaculum copahuensis TaxID=1838280 RepID=UPI000AF71A3E|nr:histidine kinase N-terminal 7TM domain-containing protein [Desulfotomaculum copahuensis]
MLASALTTLLLAGYARRNRSVRGAVPFMMTMLLVTLWSLAYALEITANGLPAKLFWAAVQYPAYAFAPVAWLVMVLQFTGRERWPAGPRLLLLMLVPAVTVLLAWTNSWHTLVYRHDALDSAGAFPVLDRTYGPWFWVHAAYSYSLNLFSLFLLAGLLRSRAALYREQALCLSGGMLVVIVVNALYIFDLTPNPRYDPTAVFFSISGLIIAWGLFRYRLFDIVPAARDRVIEEMADGLIVLDIRERVVDLNPAARRITGLAPGRGAGRTAADLFAAWPALAECCRRQTDGHCEISTGGDGRHYEVYCLPLHNAAGVKNGRLIVIRDISERRAAQEQLMSQQRMLAALQERERLARDLHDNLSQVLGYVNMQAGAVHGLLQDGLTAEAAAGLARLGEVARQAHAEAREYIQGIRGTPRGGSDFFTALRARLQRFEQNHGLTVKLAVAKDLPPDLFAPAAGTQLTRILQEALTNVRKHAGAKTVKITFVRRGGRIRISITDDGRGFDVNAPAPDGGSGFGLGIMRERAQEAGGILRIESVPGRGTRVTVDMPYPEEEFRDESAAGRRPSVVCGGAEKPPAQPGDRSDGYGRGRPGGAGKGPDDKTRGNPDGHRNAAL